MLAEFQFTEVRDAKEISEAHARAVELGISDSFTKHLQGMHDQANHGRRGPIQPGINSWHKHVPKLLEAAEQIDSTRGNAVLATFTEAAGFNGKPQILSQADFDALEGETIYRGMTDEAYVEDFKESLVQYAGEGVFGNGTYASNMKESTYYYAGYGDDGNLASIEPRLLEMKLLPEADVISFDDAFAMKEWRSRLTSEWVTAYKAKGKNPQEVQEVEWQLGNDSDWTNIAIMEGIDAVRFRPIDNENQSEYYTIILNRGKVAVNGNS